MAHLSQNDDPDYTLEDYYSDFDDSSSSEGSTPRSHHDDSFDSDLEDDFDVIKKSKTDTTAAEARKGKDIQGLPWERFSFTREQYRENRVKKYNNFESLSFSREGLDKECMQVEKGNRFYDFQFNTRLVKSTILHFQLRNLVWATSKYDVYLVQHYSLMHWSALRRRSKGVLNVGGRADPSLAVSRVQVTTMSVKDNLLVAGGFQGELICKYLNQDGVVFSTKLTADNAITNAVDVFSSSSGPKRVVAGNNDAHVRVFDTTKFACINSFQFSWPVNNTSVSGDGKLMAVLGDCVDGVVVDAQSGKVVSNLRGHRDYSFTSAWHPNGQILATGNQDTTCRLWDMRNTSESFAVLKGRMGAIRSIKFTSDGRFMAMAEPADFVHIFDVNSGYKREQEIDLFGEIAGISFSPDTEALFVAVADRNYGSLMEFNRRHNYQFLDSFF